MENCFGMQQTSDWYLAESMFPIGPNLICINQWKTVLDWSKTSDWYATDSLFPIGAKIQVSHWWSFCLSLENQLTIVDGSEYRIWWCTQPRRSRWRCSYSWQWRWTSSSFPLVEVLKQTTPLCPLKYCINYKRPETLQDRYLGNLPFGGGIEMYRNSIQELACQELSTVQRQKQGPSYPWTWAAWTPSST